MTAGQSLQQRDTSLPAARWATFATFVANGFAFGAWATALPTLKALLSLSAGELSLALLAMPIGGVIAMQFASRLIPALGGTGKATLLIGIVFAFVFALPLLSPNLAVLVVVCAAIGAINCLMDVAMNTHAATVEKAWGAAIMSSFHAGFSLGGLMGTGTGALLLLLHIPAFALLAIPAAAVLVMVIWSGRFLGPGDTDKHPPQPIFRLPEKSIALLAVVLSLCFLAEGAMADWSAIYLSTLGVSAAGAAAGYAAFSATMVLGRLTGDSFVRRHGRARVIGVGCSMAATGMILATAVPQFFVVVAGFALVGAGLSNVVPCVFSTAAERASSPAAGIAEVSTAGFGGFFGGPPLIGAVAGQFGMRAGIGVIAAAASVATLIALQLKPMHPRGSAIRNV